MTTTIWIPPEALADFTERITAALREFAAAVAPQNPPDLGAGSPETAQNPAEVAPEGAGGYAASTGRVCDREGCTSPTRHYHGRTTGAEFTCSVQDCTTCYEPRPQPEPDGDPTPLATLRNAIAAWRERTNPDDDLARLFDYHEDAARIIACAVDLVAGQDEDEESQDDEPESEDEPEWPTPAPPSAASRR